MGRFASWMNNAATDFEGFSRWMTALFVRGAAAFDGWTVVQRVAGANMSVDVTIGEGVLMTVHTAAWCWTTTVENVTIGAASANNRRDIVVAYLDMSVSNPSTSTPNNPGALKFMVVQGTPATSPSDPSFSTIQAAVGAANPFIYLARVSLTSSTTQITNAQITSLREPLALSNLRIWAGGNSTLGHQIPNAADAYLALTSRSDGHPDAGALNNPYKFDVYLAVSQNIGTGDTKVAFDTKNYDTGSNVDVTTNKGRFTAPIAGFYHFDANIFAGTAGSGTGVYIQLNKNGTLVKMGNKQPSAAVGTDPGATVSANLQLAAGDYIEVFAGSGAAAKALQVASPAYNSFSGFLISKT
jgi:hypothetical protein